MPLNRPFSPSATASTSGGPGSEVKTNSAVSATARGVSAHTAPAVRYGSAAARRKSWTTSSWPAFCRLAAIPAPITRQPMNPIFFSSSALMLCPALFLLEHVFRHQCRSHRRRPAGIECEMGDDLAKFVFAQTVVEGALQMADELLLAAES